MPILAPLYRPEPKSVRIGYSAPMLSMIAAERGSTGSFATSRFQGSSSGNGRMPPRLAPGPRATVAAQRPAGAGTVGNVVVVAAAAAATVARASPKAAAVPTATIDPVPTL